MIKRAINKIVRSIALLRNDWYVKYLRSKGVQIGEGCVFRHRDTIRIDVSRPSLITIGNHVRCNMNFQLLTHDYGAKVFTHKYNDFINSSGKVNIGNNIYFGTNVVVLKGVSIGDNCVIGAGSIVSKSIPANSVAVGCPAKVVCTIDEYYERRKKACIDEAFEYANSITERFGREPRYEDFWEEFHLFVDAGNIHNYPNLSVSGHFGEGYAQWMENHKAPFANFEEFIKEAKLHKK